MAESEGLAGSQRAHRYREMMSLPYDWIVQAWAEAHQTARKGTGKRPSKKRLRPGPQTRRV